MLTMPERDMPTTKFEEFWRLYPKQDGEAAAHKEWKFSVRKSDEAAIMAAVRGTAWPTERRFIPSAARWLRERRWENYKPGGENGKYRGLSEEV